MVDAAVWLGLIGLGGLSPSTAVLVIRHRDGERWRGELTAYRLRLPADLDLARVGTFLSGLSGLLPERRFRPFVVRGLGFEIVANEAGIAHYLIVPRSQADIITSQLRAALPNLGVVSDPEYRPPTPTLAGELATANSNYQLRIDRPESISSAILAALQPLEPSESAMVQWLLFPSGQTQPPGGPAVPGLLGAFVSGRSTEVEPPKPVQEKYAEPMFMVVGRLGVVSASSVRDRQLLARLTASFHAANSSQATLRRRSASSPHVAAALVRRTPPLTGAPCRLNSLELVGLMALPAAQVSLPGLEVGAARQLAPSTDIPRIGRVVADATFPGMVRPLAISVTDSLSHLHVVGPTGVGKSTLLLNLVLQDIEAGYGVILIEPKGDLVDEVLDRLPEHRWGDVAILDPTDDGRPVGLNLFAGGQEDPELVAEQVLGTFHRLYRQSWGPRTDDVLRSALLTIVRVPGMTLAEVPLLLSDANFRRRLVGGLDDPVGLGPFWSWFESLGESERTQVIGPVQNKLRAVTVRPRLRRVLGQAEPLLDFDDVLSSGKILLVPLSKGLMGEDAAALLGSLLIARLWQAVQRRTRLALSARPPVFCAIDEFQDYVNLPTPVPDVLAQARALGLGLTLAHQHLGQLDHEVQEAVLANCRSRVIFQTASSDARRLAREMQPYVRPDDLQGLRRHEILATLSAHGRTTPPASGLTRPAPESHGRGGEIRQQSRQRFGRDQSEVEAEIRLRHDRPVASGQLQRRRRSA